MGERNGFADVDYEEALRRAHRLIPRLRELAGAAEEARGLTPEILALLHESGLSPARYRQLNLVSGAKRNLA